MALTRRDFGLLAAAAGLAAGPASAEAPMAAIVAEGGAAEERIEDTRSALDLAINQGCDFIQLNLAPTKEGALVARFAGFERGAHQITPSSLDHGDCLEPAGDGAKSPVSG